MSPLRLKDVTWEYVYRWLGRFGNFEEPARRVGRRPNHVAEWLRGTKLARVAVLDLIQTGEGLKPSDVFAELAKIAAELDANPTLVDEHRLVAAIPRKRGRKVGSPYKVKP